MGPALAGIRSTARSSGPSEAAALPLAPVGHGDACSLERLTQGLAMAVALGIDRLALLAHALAQGIAVGGGADAALALLQDGDAGLVVLQGKGAGRGEHPLPLFRGEPGAAAGGGGAWQALGLGAGAGGQQQGSGDQGAGDPQAGTLKRIHGRRGGERRNNRPDSRQPPAAIRLNHDRQPLQM